MPSNIAVIKRWWRVPLYCGHHRDRSKYPDYSLYTQATFETPESVLIIVSEYILNREVPP